EEKVAEMSGTSLLKEGDGVFVNPSPPTLAKLPAEGGNDGGKELRFVMVWHRTLGGGWVPLRNLKDGDAKDGKNLTGDRIAAAARRSHRAVGGAKPEGGTQTYVFRSQTDTMPSGQGKYVLPGQTKKSNLATDHMERHREPQENGQTDAQWDEATTYYNVFANLPGPKTAGVAVDIGKPGEEFQVFQNAGRPLSRSVPTYDKRKDGKSKRQKGLMFYYGYRKGQPDKRGWVLRECIEKGGGK
ncbi:MAG TPA: hypothetical protein PLA94_20875, partial [Myxococcota bacterium]|nr:hypothetical protein [Myxococcota bacterium]